MKLPHFKSSSRGFVISSNFSSFDNVYDLSNDVYDNFIDLQIERRGNESFEGFEDGSADRHGI